VGELKRSSEGYIVPVFPFEIVTTESEAMEARHRYGGYVNVMGVRILILVSVCSE